MAYVRACAGRGEDCDSQPKGRARCPGCRPDDITQEWLLKVLRIMLGLLLQDEGAHYHMQIQISLHSKGLFLCPCFSIGHMQHA